MGPRPRAEAKRRLQQPKVAAEGAQGRLKARASAEEASDEKVVTA